MAISLARVMRFVATSDIGRVQQRVSAVNISFVAFLSSTAESREEISGHRLGSSLAFEPSSPLLQFLQPRHFGLIV